MSTSIRERVAAQTRALGLEERVRRLADLARRLEDSARELDEARELVPAWNRVFFFVRTPDRERENDLAARLEALGRELEAARASLRNDLGRLGDEIPPFGLALDLGDALEAARGRRRVPGDREKVLGALERIARRIEATWTHGLDPAHVLERLSSATACSEAAAKADAAPLPDARPRAIADEELAPLVARRLLANGYFAAQEQAGDLTAQRNRLRDEHESAAAAVPFLDRINPFGKSPAERRRDELAKELLRTEEALREARETGQQRLEESLEVYPPLAVRRRVAEAVGIGRVREARDEDVLVPGGEVASRRRDATDALLAAALGRVTRSVRQAFPGVPLPGELPALLSGEPPPAPARRDSPVVASALRGLARSSAPAARDRALEHAALVVSLGEALERVRARITLADRLRFWEGTTEKEQARRLFERQAWHAERRDASLRELLEGARAATGALAPFQLRDGTIAAIRRVAAIRTDEPTIRDGPSFDLGPAPVHGREEALLALGALEAILVDVYGLPRDNAELLAGLEHATPREVPVLGDEHRLFRRLDRDELLALLASKLDLRDLADARRRHEEVASLHRRAHAEHEAVASRLGFWDRIHFLSPSPDALRTRELGATRDALAVELDEALARITARLDEALEAYPPALLVFALASVRRALGAIVARRRYRWRLVRRRRPGSPGIMAEEVVEEQAAQEWSVGVSCRPPPERWIPEPEWEYRWQLVTTCELEGKEGAVAAMRRWAARFVRSYGELPGDAELLETWLVGEALEA